MKKLLLLIIFAQFITNCSDSTNSQERHFDLPSEFPLKSGNAWIYERHLFVGGTHSMVLDTLYILGMHGEYYKYSWQPNEYYILVKNQDNKFLAFGAVFIDPPDTNLFNRPLIWTFFGEDTGFVELEYYRNTYDIPQDRIHIGIEKDIEMFDNTYDAYVETHMQSSLLDIDHYSTVDGSLKWVLYNLENGEIRGTIVMKQKIEDFPPPEALIKKATHIKDINVEPNGKWNYNSPDGNYRQ
jgi:hypothetical protein